MRFLAALQFLILKTEGALEHFKNLSSSSPVFALSKQTIFRQSQSLATVLFVPDHNGGWAEEVNACFLNSYIVYL
jgi:hypothetical protein